MHYLSFDKIIFINILMAVCINSIRQTSSKSYPQLKEKTMSFGVFQVNIYSFHFNQQITENMR